MKLYLFPYSKVKQGSKIVIWGNGIVGKEYVQQLENQEYCEILAIVDEKISGTYKGICVANHEQMKAKILEADYIIIAIENKNIQIEIKEILKKMNIEETVIVDDIILNNFDEACELNMLGTLSNKSFIKSCLTYSQHGEDLVLCMLFKLLDIDKPTYLDLGANHPWVDSNTALFYLLGSRGVNVDANPDIIPLLMQHRPEDMNLNRGVAISGQTEEVLTFYRFDKFSQVNTFDEHMVQEWKIKNPSLEIKDEILVTMIGVDEIVEKYCDGKWPDFLDIDIEGMDYEVLKSSGIDNEGPKVILAEVRVNEEMAFNEMMEKKGYAKYCRIWSNILYIRKDIMHKIVICY